MGKLNRKLWNGIKKKSAARFKDSGTFMYPLAAPLKILSLSNFVVEAVFVVLAEVKRWICKHTVNSLGMHVF